jgi:hypothetical protein
LTLWEGEVGRKWLGSVWYTEKKGWWYEGQDGVIHTATNKSEAMAKLEALTSANVKEDNR